MYDVPDDQPASDAPPQSPPARRDSSVWARRAPSSPPQVDVLIPTYNRDSQLGATLAGLAAQDDPAFRVIISDQSDGAPAWADPAVRGWSCLLPLLFCLTDLFVPWRSLVWRLKLYMYVCTPAV